MRAARQSEWSGGVLCHVNHPTRSSGQRAARRAAPPPPLSHTTAHCFCTPPLSAHPSAPALQAKAKYDPELERQASEWISALTGAGGREWGGTGMDAGWGGEVRLLAFVCVLL